ncbi:MAG: hypothetical protein DMG80_19080 [Acidobacteria bacterium]|nr:MAG: hypothetical protein DMG80_19080 [Acidobacteriota bacterium]
MNCLPRKISLGIALSIFLTGCAQTGPPLPPSLELPKPPSDLRAGRKGNEVTLTWTEPTRTTDRKSVRYLGPTRICRSIEAEMKDCGNPVGQLPTPPQSSQAAASAQPQLLVFVDRLPPEILQQIPNDLTYAVEVLNRDGRSAGLSNRVQVAAVPTLPPPSDFHAELTASGVEFAWTTTGASLAPGVQHRYRIYRRDESTGKDAVAAEVPIAEAGPMRAQDLTLEWEKTYLYRITSVSVLSKPGGEVQVEGDDSPAIRIVAHDTFPPAVPAGLQAVFSGEGQKAFVDLIWAPATDADLAGYNVYRHEADSAAVKLNSHLIKAPAYRDDSVAPGKTYYYSVSSVDVRGNESARPEETSETVP